MKISYFNIGCKVNFAELSEIQKNLERDGAQSVDFGDKADVIIINTCTVTQNADADCRKIIRRARRSNPDAFIAVVGCYSQLRRDELISLGIADAVLGNEEKYRLPEILSKLEINGKNFEKTDLLINDSVTHELIQIDELDRAAFHGASSLDNESHTRVVLKIQDGCDYYCTYCAVAYARGNSRSMDFEEFKRRIFEIDHSEFYEVVLSGINLGTYKSNTGENFTDLIHWLSQEKTKLRFRISSIEPNLITDDMIKIISDSNNICPHFHIPMQSGSDKILNLMKRRYNTNKFEKVISKINNSIKDCCIGIDVITGFPGESEKDFQDTYDLLEKLPISYLHVFTYSDRIGTDAFNMPDKVSPQEKKARTIALRDLSDRKKAEIYNSQFGSNHTIIPETYNSENSNWTGWTENYVHVLFQAHQDLARIPIKIRLEKISDGKVWGVIIPKKVLPVTFF